MIRIAAETDAAEILRIYAPAVTQGVTSFEMEVPPLEVIRHRIAETLFRYPWLVEESGSHLSGFAHASFFRWRMAYQWTVEVSVYVDETRRRTGCATRLYERLFDILRAQGFYSAYAAIATGNHASEHLHRTFGFQAVGLFPAVGYKMGSWRDVAFWHLPLHELPAGPPDPPTWFQDWTPQPGFFHK